MSLPDRLVSIITGDRPPAPGGDTFRERADALWRAAGTQRRAAELAGVDRRTFQRWYQRWNAGAEPRIRPGTAGRVEQGLRRAALVGATNADVRLSVTDHGGRAGGRVRTLTAVNFRLADDAMERVAEAWVRTGSADAAARAFLAAVQVPFYRQWLANGWRIQDPQGTHTDPTDDGESSADDGESDEYDGDELDTFDAWDEFHDAAADAAADSADIPSDYGGLVA